MSQLFGPEQVRWASRWPAVVMTQSITINLSDRLYEQLRRAAELVHQPVEVIITQSLAHSLPLLLEDIPQAYQPDDYPLIGLYELWQTSKFSVTFRSCRTSALPVP